MKSIFTLTIFSIVLLLSGCTQTTKDGKQIYTEQSQSISIKAPDVVKNGDATPVSFLLTPAMAPGDTLVLRHKQNIFARITLDGEIRLKQLSLRIRAMGTGNIVAFLHKKNGQEVGWRKHIKVKNYSPIPAKNVFPLKKRERIQDSALKMIVMNSSAEEEYIKKVTVDFDVGKIIIHGSKYFSKHPYFAIYPERFPGKPKVDIKLAY